MQPPNRKEKKFRRPFAEEEMSEIQRAFRSRRWPYSLVAAFKKMWDIVLMECEGFGWDSPPQGWSGSVMDYAIPHRQYDELQVMMTRRHPERRETVAFEFMMSGPMFYEEGD